MGRLNPFGLDPHSSVLSSGHRDACPLSFKSSEAGHGFDHQ